MGSGIEWWICRIIILRGNGELVRGDLQLEHDKQSHTLEDTIAASSVSIYTLCPLKVTARTYN